LHDWDKSIADYSKAIELAPEAHVNWFHRGIAYRELGQWDKVAADYSELLKRYPDDFNALYWRGVAYANLKQPEKAIHDYSKVIERDPKNASALANLAWLLATCPEAKFRDVKKAVEFAKKAVEMAPKEGTHRKTLGAAQYRAGDWKESIAALEKSMELRNGGDSFEWFFLAMAHWQLGTKDDARKWYDRAAEWMDKNATDNDELRRFRDEAEKLLEIKKE
jgi:tetratricopeptide (TPR) repeat protein